MDALRSSLASDIVELVVLSTDECFLQTLRDAVGPSRRLWHVLSSDKVGDLLLAGGVGIVVLDVDALREAFALFITQMKQQFPDLVIVVAGARDAETALARLISDGTVYRFIHKPMSPARARLFADAAVKRFEDQRRRVSEMTAAAAKPSGSGGLMIAGGCAAICAIAGGIWALTHGDTQNTPATTAHVPAAGTVPAPDPRTAVSAADSELLARATQALAANRLIAPSGDNALELYLQELARNPANAEARSGIAALRERLVARAQNALLEERLDEAAAALDTARRAGADSGSIALLAAELLKARGHVKRSADSATAKAQAAVDGASPAPDPAEPSAALAMQRIRDGRLLEPETDSARFYVQQALNSNPGSAAAERASEALALGLLNAARSAIDRKDLAAASSWLDGADGIASPTNIENLRHLLAAAEHRTKEADAPPQASEQLPQENRPAPDIDHPNAAVSAAENATRGSSASEVIDAGHLVLVKSVQPDYPLKARTDSIEGWVEIEFTVAESGRVKDAAVRAANPRGVFDQAAIDALLQWHYKPVLVDAKPVARRARIRIRFALAG
jgi:TonB family protein